MEFTKENFLLFCKEIAGRGCSVSLEANECFGYFELKPYANESTVRYVISNVENTDEGIVFSCSARIREFHVGDCLINEKSFLRRAKTIGFYYYGGCRFEEIANLYKNK